MFSNINSVQNDIPAWCHGCNLKNKGVRHLGLIFQREDGDSEWRKEKDMVSLTSLFFKLQAWRHAAMQVLPFCAECTFKINTWILLYIKNIFFATVCMNWQELNYFVFETLLKLPLQYTNMYLCAWKIPAYFVGFARGSADTIICAVQFCEIRSSFKGFLRPKKVDRLRAYKHYGGVSKNPSNRVT